jgi:uncharacterized coiled-coil protein SlyX
MVSPRAANDAIVEAARLDAEPDDMIPDISPSDIQEVIAASQRPARISEAPPAAPPTTETPQPSRPRGHPPRRINAVNSASSSAQPAAPSSWTAAASPQAAELASLRQTLKGMTSAFAQQAATVAQQQAQIMAMIQNQLSASNTAPAPAAITPTPVGTAFNPKFAAVTDCFPTIPTTILHASQGRY